MTTKKVLLLIAALVVGVSAHAADQVESDEAARNYKHYRIVITELSGETVRAVSDRTVLVPCGVPTDVGVNQTTTYLSSPPQPGPGFQLKGQITTSNCSPVAGK